jgi:uncharacterized protein (DUF736 family)
MGVWKAICGRKRRTTTRKREAPDEECCVEERSTQKVPEECGMNEKSKQSQQRSDNGNSGVPILTELCPDGGDDQCSLRWRHGNSERGVPMEIEEWYPSRGAMGVRGDDWRAEWNVAVTLQAVVCRCESRSSHPGLRIADQRGIECGMKWSSTNPHIGN